MYGRICDPGMGPYLSRVALAHAGCIDMAGILPVRYQPSRKSQQPLAWIWRVELESANRTRDSSFKLQSQSSVAQDRLELLGMLSTRRPRLGAA